MNKTSLFATLGIVLAFTTALIFGSIVTPASAQGNTTVTMDNMTNMTAPMNNTSSMNMTMDNMTAPMNNTSSMNMTMDNMYYLKYLVQEDLVDGHCPNPELHI